MLYCTISDMCLYVKKLLIVFVFRKKSANKAMHEEDISKDNTFIVRIYL